MLEELKFKELVFHKWENSVTALAENAILKEDCADVKRLLTNATEGFKRDCIMAGFVLSKIEQEGYYKRVIRRGVSYACYGDSFITEPFYKFCEEFFGLSKTSVYALKGVAFRFANEKGVLKEEYKDYTYSCLVEMCSMSKDLLASVTPEMTVQDIRKKKKVSKPSNVVPEEKIVSPVVSGTSCVFDDMTAKKEEFKKLVKYLFEQNKCLLYMNNDKTGGQAFGTCLFDYLENKGFFNADKKMQVDGLL